MWPKAQFILCSLAVLLGGCATFHSKPLHPDETAATFEKRTLNDLHLQTFIRMHGNPDWTLPPATWTLDQLALVAFYEHADLDVARAQWHSAQAAETTASERPNPTLSAGPTWVSNPDVGLTPWIYAFALDIPIETAGKRGIRQRQAAAFSEAARQNLAFTAWQLRANVRTALTSLIAIEQAAGVLRHQGEELDRNARLLADRSASGSLSPFNAAQATALAGKNQLALEDALRLATDARSQLADAVGLPLRALDGISLSSATVFANLKAPLLLQARRAALTSRSDLLASLATYAASEAAVQLEIAKQYPDIHLGPGYSYDQGQNKWGIGVTFPIPIFNQNGGVIGEAEARRVEAAARFIALQDKIINQIDKALANYEAAYRKLNISEKIFQTQIQQNRSLQNRLRPGDVARFALFRSQLDLDSAELALGDARRQAQEAQGALEDALEHPLTSTLTFRLETIENNPRQGNR